MRRPNLPLSLIVAGTGTIGVALVWWSLSYAQVWSNRFMSITEASRCLMVDAPVCRLATALCGAQHGLKIAAYSPTILWLGIALLCGSLATRARS